MMGDMEQKPDLRRDPRARVSWPVTVEAANKLFHLETMNLSPSGAKLRLKDAPLEPGTPAMLRLYPPDPPDRPPVDIQGIVWRVDPDGPAFFFLSVDSEDFVFPTEASESVPRES